MTDTQRKEGKVVGGALFLLGVLALWEGWRLHALRTQMVAGAVVGDDTFPLIVGVVLLLLGAGILFVARLPQMKVARPYGEPRQRVILAYLGYTGSTALVSTGLFRAMGGYRWPLALLLGGVTTGLLYLMFRVWLLQPLPTGLLGF